MTRPGDPARLLSDLIQLNTSNPPGNEEAAVLYLEALLKSEGIETEVYASAPGRASLLGRVRGRMAGRPVVLLSHLDVVPAGSEGWDEDPFSGAIKNGCVYGRGAIDMKSQVAAFLLSFLELKRSGVTPECDILFLATADEETGGKMGIDYVVEKVPELQRASFVLSEGGCIIEEEGRLHAQVSVSEKKIAQFMVRARGTGGHASMPHKDNANDKVVRAAQRLIDHKTPFRPTPVATRYLTSLLKGKKVGRATFTTLREALRDERQRAFIEGHPMYNAILRNTLTLTILKGGEKVNVIPTESSAYFDMRLLPEEDSARFLKQVARVAGPDVEVVSLGKNESTPSSYRTPYFRMIADVVRGMKKGSVPVLPFITTGATDLRYFRQFGITAYGFFPMILSKDELFSMHSVNERISVEALEEGCRATDRMVKLLASYRPL